MSTPLPWSKAPPPADSPLGRAARKLAALPTPPELSPEQLARLAIRIEDRITPSHRSTRPWLRYASAAACIFGAPLAFAAVVHWVLPAISAPPKIEAPASRPGLRSVPTPSAPAEPQRPDGLSVRDDEALGLDLSELPSDATASHTRRSPVPKSKGVARADPGEAVPRPGDAELPAAGGEAPQAAQLDPQTLLVLQAESKLISHALMQLPSQPAEALRTLDEYRRKFPRGILAQEARVARVQALLTAGQRSAAFEELSAMTLSDYQRVPHGMVMLAVRGELALDLGRPEQALDTFTTLLAQPAPRSVQERALWGRAQAQEKLDGPGAARADLERYLEEFPQGRFSANARAKLQAL